MYFIIPITFAVFFCCIFCCVGAYYKKNLFTTQRKTREIETQTETEPESLETDVIHIRTVEQPRRGKNSIKRSSSMSDSTP